MAIFRKEILRAGKYAKGDLNFEVTGGNLKAFHDTYNKSLAPAGLLAPLVWEHEPSGSRLGQPMTLSQLRDKAGQEAKHGAGFMTRTELKGDRLYGVFEVIGEDDAQRLSDGRVRFVSPELRPAWQDGKGRVHHNVISHVALTHKPIICDQEPGFKTLQASDDSAPFFSGVIRLSDSAGGVIRLSDDEENLGDEGYSSEDAPAPEPEDNPDMPADESPSDESTRLAALVAHLEKIGLPLPSDTTMENLVDRLLTACMVKAAHDQQPEEDGDGDEDDDGTLDIEEAQPQLMQMSASTDLGRRVSAALKEKRITPALGKAIIDRVAIQLSGKGGNGSASIKVAELVDMLEDFPQLSNIECQLSDSRERRHPKGRSFLDGRASLDDPNSSAAEREAEKFLKRTGRKQAVK